jgi:hypothetical protein
VRVRIYVEGGSQGSTKANCRKAFKAFLGKVVAPGSFTVIASGSRQNAYEDFCSALRQHQSDYVILLVDSETAVATTPWQHLNGQSGDRWQRPQNADESQAQLMVRVMESWFLADHQALADYYGQEFMRNALPRQPDIEQIDKQNVFDALTRASKPTQKGRYHKTKHGFDLLELINPDLVIKTSVHAKALFVILQTACR